MRDRAGEFPGAERVVFWGINVAPGGRPIELSLLASDIDQLEAVAEELKQHLASCHRRKPLQFVAIPCHRNTREFKTGHQINRII